jgi:MarR family transcriptional regulator, organic hydroperoxide resistance regulator
MCVGACKACRNGCTQLIRVAEFARVNPDREEPGVSANPDDDQLMLDQQVCFALTVADRRVVGLYRPLLEPLGLTHPQYLVMIALWERSPIGMRELGRRLALDSGTLSPLVGRLVAAGLLERRRGPDDRSVTIALTAQGQALRERARSVPGEVRRRLGVSEERLAALHESLLEIVAAAEARSGEPPEGRRDDGPLLP